MEMEIVLREALWIISLFPFWRNDECRVTLWILVIFKLQVFWEVHKTLKKYPTLFWVQKKVGDCSNFVAFSQYLNFTIFIIFSIFLQEEWLLAITNLYKIQKDAIFYSHSHTCCLVGFLSPFWPFRRTIMESQSQWPFKGREVPQCTHLLWRLGAYITSKTHNRVCGLKDKGCHKSGKNRNLH